MIVDDGTLKLLDAQRSYLAGLYWALFTNNVPITNATHFADLVEAAWTGYARVVAGSWNTPTLVPPRAQTTSAAMPSFSNGTAVSQTFYGWFLLDAATNTLIAAVNLGATVIPAGQTFVLAPAVTDREE